MAHPCFECQGECYCNGDIDDCITSKTPCSCEGCDMCQEFQEAREEEFDDHDWDIYEPVGE